MFSEVGRTLFFILTLTKYGGNLVRSIGNLIKKLACSSAVCQIRKYLW